MTLSQFNTDILPIINALITGGGLFFVWQQLRASANAQKQTSNWNKVNATYSFFDMDKNMELEMKLCIKAKESGVCISHKISEEDKNKILNNPELFIQCKSFLNDFETFCAAYQLGVLNKELCYYLYGSRIIKAYEDFEPLIKQARFMYESPSIFLELEKTAKDWKSKKRDSTNNQLIISSVEHVGGNKFDD